MHMEAKGRVVDAKVVREDGERYVHVETEDGSPIILEPGGDGWDELSDVVEQTSPTVDNAFRQDPDDNQTGLVEFTGVVEVSEGSDVWEQLVEGRDPATSVAFDAEDVEAALNEQKPEPGDAINPHDPAEW